MSKSTSRKPRSVRLDADSVSNNAAPNSKTGNSSRKPRASAKLEAVEFTPLTGADFPQDLELTPPPTKRRGFTWSGLVFGAAGLLISLWVGLNLETLIRELFARNEWLGWTALILSSILALGVLTFVLREIWAISRLNTINGLRQRVQKAIDEGNEKQNSNLLTTLQAIYASRADMATSRTAFDQTAGQIMDEADRLALFERHYMAPLDTRARKLVMASAKRVSVVTAISPRAMVDIGYVLVENTRLIRQISQTYGGRPGYLGFWRLTANILAHLAMTGVVAAGDSLIQQMVGHGLAARISSRIGEGVVNGLLTARIGIAAIDQSRPMPFYNEPRPQVRDYFTSLVAISEKNPKERP